MALENKLNITDSTELARMEEKISKKKQWSYLKMDIWMFMKQEHFRCLQLFTNIYLKKCMNCRRNTDCKSCKGKF